MSKIREDASKRKVTGKAIAKIIEVSRGMVSNYLKGETEMPVLKFIKLVDHVYENDNDKIIDRIKEFIAKSSRKDNLQDVLEWVSNRGDDDLFLLLYNKFLESNELMEDFKVYNLLYKRNMRKISVNDFYIQVEKLKENKYIQKETKILLKIATLYAFSDLKSYNMMFLAEDIIKDIHNIESAYIRTSYGLRVQELLAHSYLKRNMVQKSIEICNKHLNSENETNFPLPLVSFLTFLAEANIFSNPLDSLNYIHRAINTFNNANIKTHSLRKSVLESTSDFIKIHNGCFQNLYLNDKSEVAHLNAKQGNYEEALKILDEIESKNGRLSAFQLYYKGLASRDLSYVQNSLVEFINSGDSFYAQLPNLFIMNYNNMNKSDVLSGK